MSKKIYGPAGICPRCKKSFLSWSNAHPSKFCSRKCANIIHNAKVGALHKIRTPFTCLFCKKTFQLRPSLAKRQTFCSRKCRTQFNCTQVIAKVCDKCGDIFKVCKQGHGKVRHCAVCRILKYNHEAGSGKIRSYYRKLGREEVCARCGYKEYPQILQVHHKDRNRAHNRLENLELLCPNCHCIEHFLDRLARKNQAA